MDKNRKDWTTHHLDWTGFHGMISVDSSGHNKQINWLGFMDKSGLTVISNVIKEDYVY